MPYSQAPAGAAAAAPPRGLKAQALVSDARWDSADFGLGARNDMHAGNPILEAERRAMQRSPLGGDSKQCTSKSAASESAGARLRKSSISPDSSYTLAGLAAVAGSAAGGGSRSVQVPVTMLGQAAAMAAALPDSVASEADSGALASMLPSVPDATAATKAAVAQAAAAQPVAQVPPEPAAMSADQQVGSWMRDTGAAGAEGGEGMGEGVPSLPPSPADAADAIVDALEAGAEMRDALNTTLQCTPDEALRRWLADTPARELALVRGMRAWAPGDWRPMPPEVLGGTGALCRVLEYSVAVDSPFVKVDSTRVVTQQRVQRLAAGSPAAAARGGGGGEVLLISEVAHSLDVPHGDAFRTVVTLSAVAAPRGGTALRARTGVQFVGEVNAFFGGMIKSRARDEAAKATRKAVAVIEARLAESRGGPRNVGVAGAGGASLEYGSSADGDGDDDGGGMDAQCMKYAGKKPPLLNPANVSNAITLLLMVVGLVMRLAIIPADEWDDSSSAWARYVLAFGLMGFSGGVTNEIAVKMLFDPVGWGEYSLPGSGIIPKQFLGIRNTVKRMIIDTFFDREFLERELKALLSRFAGKESIEGGLRAVLDSDEFVEVMDRRMRELAEDPKGGRMSKMIKSFGIGGQQLRALTKAFLGPMSAEVSGAIGSAVDAGQGGLSPDKIAETVERLVDSRLQELTAQRVKTLIEAVMKANLGWLVVWGNVFGGIIGVISEAAGY